MSPRQLFREKADLSRGYLIRLEAAWHTGQTSGGTRRAAQEADRATDVTHLDREQLKRDC